jgi:hypothetical protein
MTSKEDYTIRDFNGVKILQRSDGYLNAGDMCNVNSKQLAHYFEKKTTKELLAKLSNSLHVSEETLVQRSTLSDCGPWVHPYVAINLAAWITPNLVVDVAQWIVNFNPSEPKIDFSPSELKIDFSSKKPKIDFSSSEPKIESAAYLHQLVIKQKIKNLDQCLILLNNIACSDRNIKEDDDYTLIKTHLSNILKDFNYLLEK